MARLTRALAALLLALLLALPAAAEGEGCTGLLLQLNAAFEDLSYSYAAFNALAAVVQAPGFDPQGPDGWMVGALDGTISEIQEGQAWVETLGRQIQAQCY